MADPTRTQLYTGTPEQREAAYQTDKVAAYQYGWVPLHREIDSGGLRVTYHQPHRESVWVEPAAPASPPVPARVARVVNGPTDTGRLWPAEAGRATKRPTMTPPAWMVGATLVILVVGLVAFMVVSKPPPNTSGTRPAVNLVAPAVNVAPAATPHGPALRAAPVAGTVGFWTHFVSTLKARIDGEGCAALQTEFDNAAAGHDRATAAGDIDRMEAQTDLMRYVDDLMRRRGCYG